MASQPTLTADYTAPTHERKQFNYSLPNIEANPSTEDRTAYLSALRSSVTKLQSEVNTFLTQKMTDDAQSSSATTKQVDEDKEEANYGEEVVE